MWPFSHEIPPSTLDQEFIQRYWDLVGRVDSLEARLEEQLDELGKRYKRSEQAERRLEEKRSEDSPCAEEPGRELHPALVALKKRQGIANAAPTRSNPVAR